MRRAVRGFIVWGAVALIVLIGGASITARSVGVASLARSSGTVELAGLSAPVRIDRDERGIPVIQGLGRDDVARALGFVHAQERFFQMDLLRRAPAGEMAALLGPPLVELDEQMRKRRLRAAAEGALQRLPEAHRRQLQAYAAGVNAGLGDLDAKSPEYLLLRAAPRSWAPADTLLVMLSVSLGLSNDAYVEAVVDGLELAMPPDVAAFLTPRYSRVDAPMSGGDEYAPLPVPGPELIDLRAERVPESGQVRRHAADDVARGSNTWAVSEAMTEDGRAILASDPHLGLSVPMIWFRAQLQWGDEDGRRRVAGVTIPGTPLVVIGSNGNVAWGPTNVHGDFIDHVVVEVDPDDPSHYRTPDGWERFQTIEETIDVRGQQARVFRMRSTRWGVVDGTDARGRPVVPVWTSADGARINLNLLEMAEARTLEAAIDVLANWWGPPQNISVADDRGRVGLVMSGWLPKRTGFDGRTPVSWADPGVGWDGQIPAEDRPTFVDPPKGFVCAANGRVVGEPVASLIGHAWPMGYRALRIRRELTSAEKLDERDMLELQLDTDVSLALDPWRTLALDVIPATERDLRLRAARSTLANWSARADLDARAVTILEALRDQIRNDLFESINTIVSKEVEGFVYRWLGSDEWVFRLLEERPANWLQPGFESWEGYRLSGVLEDQRPGGDRWAEVSRAIVRHPLSRAIPTFGLALDMPDRPVPGHWSCVRVHRRSFGASLRMVVSPGREEEGILHMPAGQSGHPLSRHYADMHEDWLRGRPTPLLAGEPVSTFRLVPEAQTERGRP